MTALISSFAACLFVFLLYRPFTTNLDKAKYVLLGFLSLMMTFSSHQRSQATNIHNFNGTLEREHIFFKLMTWPDLISHLNTGNDMTTLKDSTLVLSNTIFTISVCGLLSRWQFPITFLKPSCNMYISGLIRHGISACLFLLAILSQSTCDSTLSFTLTITSILWYLSGSYIVRRWKVVIPTLLVSSSTGYLTSYTSGGTIVNIISCTERLGFSFLLVVFCNVLDHLDAILNTYPHLVIADRHKQAGIQNAFTASYWLAMIKLALRMPSESELPKGPIEDLNTAIRALGPASRSWKTMAALFPANLRQDLCLLYAFFRTADDLVDDAPTPEQCAKNLVTIREFLFDVFHSSKTLTDSNAKNNHRDLTLPSHIDWDHYATLLPNEQVLAIFRNFARISHYLCPLAMYELTEAWELDLYGSPVKEQEDLLHYAALISGTFGELCTCVIMYKTGRGNWSGCDKVARDEDVLSKARATGQCLQLINIARDIVADSLVGRCYVPLQYMPHPPQAIYHLLKVAQSPMQVGENNLKLFAIRILNLADHISDKAQKGIEGLPDEVQDSIRAAFEIYMSIGPTLRKASGFPLRVKVPKGQQQWIALRCIYGFRGPVARAVVSVYYQIVSFYLSFVASISTTRTAPKTY